MPADKSHSFDQLHEGVRRWIWEKKWTALRKAQEEAIAPIITGDMDIIIAAATAGGKTEAAFFPILSRLATEREGSAVCVSPLKALINDQYERLELLCKSLDIPIFAWHGDISRAAKIKFLDAGNGVLIITPESLEAILVNRGTQVGAAFANLRYVVIDELHSFIGMERGRHIQSLLHRLEIVIRRKIPRIGLSATLGDMDCACEFLRPGGGKNVRLIVSDDEHQIVKLQTRGYITPITENEKLQNPEVIEISQHLFDTLRGDNNLVFANHRRNVEAYSGILRGMSEEAHIPNEFYPHHGNLSKALREDAEIALKKSDGAPATAVCTSTLEMGIDIGSVKSIAQIGVPPTVAAMRQRLGRSGRRAGEAAIMRLYIRELEITGDTQPQDSIRESLVQSIAMVRLLMEKWYEPPNTRKLHLSTMVHQMLALIAQYGCLSAAGMYEILCETGPFKNVDKPLFAEILRALGEKKLITQNGNDLLHGAVGEKIVNHYSFYAVFTTPEEFRLIAEGRVIGKLPFSKPLTEGFPIIFGGRPWLIAKINFSEKVIELIPSPGANPPTFDGEGGPVHDRIRQEMYRIYLSGDAPHFLDATARNLLHEGRENFRRYELDKRFILPLGKTTLLFTWMGDSVNGTIALFLASRGLKAMSDGLTVTIAKADEEKVKSAIKEILSAPMPCERELACHAVLQSHEKFDNYLSAELLSRNFASSELEIAKAYELLKKLV